MAIVVTCEGCGRSLRIDRRAAGRRGKCPQCGHVIQVPASPDSPSLPPAPRRKEQPAKATSPDAGTKSAVAESPDKGFPLTTSDTRVENYAARRRGPRLPVWAWFAVSSAVMAAVVGWAWFEYRRETDRRRVRGAVAAAEKPPSSQSRGNRQSFAPRPIERVQTAKPAAGATWAEIYPFVENGIVKIETYDRFNNRGGLGSGFVIDAAGLVATNYHVASAAFDKADVLFNDGTRYGVEGYVAVLPARDLAILQLNGVPPNIRSLALQSTEVPVKASPVYAIGHPHDHNFVPTSGILARFLKTPELAPESREFLDTFLGEMPDNQWIEHDAQISPGNSGGPLLNSAGEVIGVNTWVNRETRLGYALHVSHLSNLTDRRASAVTPLRDHYQQPEERFVQIHVQPYDVSAARIEQLMLACNKLKWQADSAEEYQSFQELAVALTYAARIEERVAADPATADAKTESIVQAARDAIEKLREIAWQSDQARSINRQAAAALAEPFSGVFALGQVERLWEGEDERRGLLIALHEDQSKLFVPLTGEMAPPDIGRDCLVLGMAYPASLPYGDNPLNPQQAQVVLSKSILPITPLPSDG